MTTDQKPVPPLSHGEIHSAHSAGTAAAGSPQEKPAGQPAGPSPPRTAVRSPFTTVKDGETLQDVTIRIYGSSDALDLLWNANRDILPRKDSKLSAGLSRTPEE